MEKILQYIELVLTVAGLLVVAGVFALFHQMSPWKAAAICAVVVGAVHGVIFFLIRSAQRKERRKAVRAIRQTLDNLVRNKLQVVLFSSEIQDEDWRPAAQVAVQEIKDGLDLIEAESLTSSGRR